jgi:hypothetical protein
MTILQQTIADDVDLHRDGDLAVPQDAAHVLAAQAVRWVGSYVRLSNLEPSA